MGMKTYLLTYDKNFSGVKWDTFDTKAAAAEASFKSSAASKVVFQTAADFANLSIYETTGLLNAINGTTLTRVRTLEQGHSSLFASITGLVQQEAQGKEPEASADAAEKPAKAKKKAKEPKAPKAPKAPGEKKEYSRLDLSKKINIINKTNPRREGSIPWKSYEALGQGILVSTYLERGGRRVDLKWEIDHGNVSLMD